MKSKHQDEQKQRSAHQVVYTEAGHTQHEGRCSERRVGDQHVHAVGLGHGVEQREGVYNFQ